MNKIIKIIDKAAMSYVIDNSIPHAVELFAPQIAGAIITGNQTRAICSIFQGEIKPFQLCLMIWLRRENDVSI